MEKKIKGDWFSAYHDKNLRRKLTRIWDAPNSFKKANIEYYNNILDLISDLQAAEHDLKIAQDFYPEQVNDKIKECLRIKKLFSRKVEIVTVFLKNWERSFF